MMNKYRNKKVSVHDIQFDSKDEMKYYEYLWDLKAKGEIANFELKPKFELIPSFRKDGRLSRACTYTPDFTVYHNDDSVVYVDVKSIGAATQQGELRRKLFDYKYPDLKLIWVCRNLKHGDADGWIEFDKLKKILAKQKKEKAENEQGSL